MKYLQDNGLQLRVLFLSTRREEPRRFLRVEPVCIILTFKMSQRSRLSRATNYSQLVLLVEVTQIFVSLKVAIEEWDGSNVWRDGTFDSRPLSLLAAQNFQLDPKYVFFLQMLAKLCTDETVVEMLFFMPV